MYECVCILLCVVVKVVCLSVHVVSCGGGGMNVYVCVCCGGGGVYVYMSVCVCVHVCV
jgi:hypothetical protein